MLAFLRRVLAMRPKEPEPLLGRWCHPHSHRRCDPFRKADLANVDSCMGTRLPANAPKRAVAERDSVSCFVDGFGR